MTLAEKLQNISKESGAQIPDEVKSRMKQQIEELQSTGIVENSLGKGDEMPEFALPNTEGETVSSADLLKAGNLVLSFFRGVW